MKKSKLGKNPIDPIKEFKSQDGGIARGFQTRSRYYKQYADTTFRRAVSKLKYEKKVLQDCGLDEFV